MQYSSVADASGVSEVIVNPLCRHTYIRGYAFSAHGAPVVAILRVGQDPIKPNRARIYRADLARKYPEIDANCGFEFLVPQDVVDRQGGAVEIIVRMPDRSERVLVARAGQGTTQLSGAVGIRQVQVNTVDHSIVVQGYLEGDASKFSFVDMTLSGKPLPDVRLTLSPEPPPSTDPKRPARRNFVLKAPSARLVDGEMFQVFSALGENLRVAFRLPRHDYTLTAQKAIAQEDQFSAVGAVHRVRLSKANGLTEIRGAFLGFCAGARVELELAGKPLGRPARLERNPVSVSASLSRVFDSPFSDWTWCDELPPDAMADKVIKAKLLAGNRVIGSAELRVKADAVEKVAEALEPSYFVSALEPFFARLVSLAKTASVDPTVYMVFPGDLFHTFGGGPARVIEMARYLTRMGYAVSIIDMTENQEGFDQVPAEHADVFRTRLGLPKVMLEEFTQLALDYMLRESGVEHTREALGRAMEDPGEPLADLILRRSNARFNALTAFLLALAKPDFVICNFAWTADVFDSVPSTVCKILDIHDVQHQRGLMHKAITGDESYMTSLEVELEAIRKADYVLAIQEEDKEFVITESGRNNVIFCSHAKAIVDTPSVSDETHRMLFIGNRYPPNTIGLRNFIERSWPLIREQVPDAVLLVVGSVVQDFAEAPAGVEMMGKVPDLDPVYGSVALVINPVEFGSGLNIKSVEALCHGRCLVTTEFGLRGLAATDEEVYRTPAAEMPQAIVDLLRHPEHRRKLEQGAVAFAQRALVADKVFRELFNTMELRLYS